MFTTPFYVLENEMRLQRHTVKTLSNDIGMQYATLYKQLREGRNVLLDTAIAIKATLGYKKSIEELFAKREDEVFNKAG